MEIKGIKYIAPMLDNSGYAQASRGNIMALHGKGIPLTLMPISFEAARPDLGKDGEILNSLINKKIDYNAVVIHTTPEFWADYREEDKTNVGYTIWETDKLHPKWPPYINDNVDKVLVGCEWNVEVFKNSGVTKPIGVVPHGINMDSFKNIKPFGINGLAEDDFVFYDVMQWTERKNPLAVIKAYWYAFQNSRDKVALVLKTYRNDYSDQEKEAIRGTIRRLKKVTPADHYPKILLILNMLSDEEIFGLHKRGDCYASLDRGEGFGLPSFTAGAVGNSIIITGLGGVTEYAKPDNSYLVDYSLTPVFGMPWCISLNSIIKTANGYVKVADLKAGEEVYNKNLNLKKINKIKVRSLNNDKEHVLSFKYYSMPDSIKVTNNHKLYVLNEEDRPTLKKASDINVGDYLVTTKPNIISWENDYIRDSLTSVYIKYEQMNDFCYLAGLYLAEGHVSKSGYYVSFAFNIKEKNTLGFECKYLMKKVFKLTDDDIYERDLVDRNGYEVNFNNKNIALFFVRYFGTGSHYKFITQHCKFSKFNYRLLRGYWDGDGHISYRFKNINKNKKRYSPECVAETASFDLALDLRDIMLCLNIVPSLRKSVRNDGRISYVLSVSDKEFDNIFNIEMATRIKSRHKKKFEEYFGVLITKKEEIDNFNEPICSISVDIDEDENKENGGSYILNGIVSSNSPWYRLDQLWAEPDILDGANKMRYVYENQKETKKKGLKLQKYIGDSFSWEVIGNKIIKEIEML